MALWTDMLRVHGDELFYACSAVMVAVYRGRRPPSRSPMSARDWTNRRKQFAGSVECESLVESGRPAQSIALIADQRRTGVVAMGLGSSQESLGSLAWLNRVPRLVSREGTCVRRAAPVNS